VQGPECYSLSYRFTPVSLLILCDVSMYNLGNSVHFPEGCDDMRNLESLVDGSEANPTDELVPAFHKRNLDEWCFAEHLDRHILLQVLSSGDTK